MYIHKHRYIFIYMKTYNWTYNACIYISTDIYLLYDIYENIYIGHIIGHKCMYIHKHRYIFIYMKTYNWTYNM